MLEIIGIIVFTRHLAKVSRAKGRSGWWAAIGPVLWVFGEFVGAFVAACAGIDGLALYLGALVGAVVGAAAAFGIVSAVPGSPDFDPYEAGAGEAGAACPACGSVQTEVIGATIVCNACGEHSTQGAFAPPRS